MTALAMLSLQGTWLHGLSLPFHHRKPARPMVVGYFPQWGLYAKNPYTVKAIVASGAIRRLDQMNYAQGFVTNGRCSVADPRADLGTTYSAAESVSGRADNPASPFRGYFHQVQELKRRYPKLRVLISLEGNPKDFAFDAQPENRQAFVASCIDTFVRGNFAQGVHEPGIFDGFDINWEFPHEADAANYRALLEEFRRQMNAVRGGMRLSVAVGHSPHMSGGTDFGEIAKIVDQVAVMNYDYSGPWSHNTGLIAPLFTDPNDPHHDSVEQNIAEYEAAGVPSEKILMGLPFYGYSWTGVAEDHDGLHQPGQPVHEDQPYNAIAALIPTSTVYRDPQSQAPWLYDGKTFWTYEDAVSVRYKASFAADRHLGGIMIWELSGDTSDGILLNTAYKALRDPIRAEAFARAVRPAEAEESQATPVATAE
ncbi:glycoside hydrolase family 18 protein [Silvibacterium sp.]|uniref:glycoside hydrolase family 18 protein n=1 Tax=Silvibacterium sp. TaxID=1964179 RepID=UPI0039E24049